MRKKIAVGNDFSGTPVAVPENKGLEERIIEVESELKQALADVHQEKESINQKLEDAVLEDIDSVRPVIEQDIEPKAYNHASYELNAHSGSNSYETHYRPAEAQIQDNSAAYSVSTADHELLQEAQEIQQRARDSQLLGIVDVQSLYDANEKHVKEEIKFRSMGMWYMMYQGVQFN